MEGAGAANAIPIVGQPVVYGAGFVALLVVTLSTVLGAYFHTFAHEGGHMLAIGLTARRITGFWLEDDTGGLTTTPDIRWALSTVVIAVAGYAAPPLLGLGGAALLAHGNVLAVLLIVAFLSLVALRFARNGLATLVPLLLVIGTLWALLGGTAFLQAALAVGYVWFLLISGAIEAFRLPSRDGDARLLAVRTKLPGLLWKAVWIVVGVASLIAGGRYLLVP